jgi:hypothetical protein
MTDQEAPKSRDEAFWAKPVSATGLHVGEVPADAVNLNVEGRRVAAMAGGFGRMYQVTYKVRLEGADATPQDVVGVWKANFATFWPKKNKFFGSTTPIAPGDVALLNVKTGGVKTSTGVLVLYADDESFSFMTPEGHMFNGMITFSAFSDEGVTVAQVQCLIRAQDPMYEVGMMLGGKGAEDRMWLHVLKQLASHFGVETRATAQRVLVDKKRQWEHWRNIKKNAAIRSGMHMATTPFRAVAKPFKSKKRVAV